MKTIQLLSLIVALVGASRVLAGPVPLEQWSANHAVASQELGNWVKAHPEAAHEFFEWDGHHPVRSQEFVIWTIEHPQERFNLYVRDHPGEPYLDRILRLHAVAAREFMVWCRNHGPAARALMAHPRGLEWAGNHLYRELWHLQRPGQ